MKRVQIVIPLYNEIESLPTLVYRMNGVYKMLKDDYDIGYILVNDGSRDGTAEALGKAYPLGGYVTLISHEKNQGFGAALKTGLRAALDAGAEYIITIDGDTNYDHFLIPLMLEELTDGIDIVTASPWHPLGSRKLFPKNRLIFSLTLSWLYARVIGPEFQPLYCYSAGFRVYRRKVIEAIDFQGRDYLATAEIIIRSLLNGFKVLEFPTQVHQRFFGLSKMKYIPQVISHLKFLKWIADHKEEFRSPRAREANP